MSQIKTWIVVVIAVIACGLGWAAAMYVNAGPPLGDEEDTYVRYKNALTNQDTLTRLETLVKLTKQLTPETVHGAARAYGEDVYPLANSDIRILMAWWADWDARDMVETVSTWNNLRVQQIAITEAITNLARKEGYEATRAYWDTLPTAARQQSHVALTLAFADYGDLTDLPDYILSIEDYTERDMVAAVAMVRFLDNVGPQALQDWVDSLPPGNGNTSSLKVVAFRASQKAHMDRGFRDEFVAWLERNADEPWIKGGWRSVAIDIAKTDPLAAIEWARALPEDHDRLNVVQEAVRVYAARDGDNALKWILEQEPNEELDRGSGVLANQVVSRNPVVAVELLSRIIGQTTFENARRQLINFWTRYPEEKKAPVLKAIRAAGVTRQGYVQKARERREMEQREAEGSAEQSADLGASADATSDSDEPESAAGAS